MSTESGRAISDDHDHTQPVIDVSKIPSDPNTPRCCGCQSYHGAVGATFLCMEAEIYRLRAQVKLLTLPIVK